MTEDYKIPKRAELNSEDSQDRNILEDILGMFDYFSGPESYALKHGADTVDIFWGGILDYDKEYHYDFHNNTSSTTRTPIYRHRLQLLHVESANRLFITEGINTITGRVTKLTLDSTRTVRERDFELVFEEELQDPTLSALENILREQCTFFKTQKETGDDN